MVRHHYNKTCTLSRHFFVVVVVCFFESNYDVFVLVEQQEIPENGGISDQKFYCGPVGAAFDYNEFILPYVGVAIMFFSVVYSRYGSWKSIISTPYFFHLSTLGVHFNHLTT
jgi:hypothetical protein